MSDYEMMIKMLLSSKVNDKFDWQHSFSGENYIIEFYQDEDYYCNTILIFDEKGKFLWFE